MIITWKATHAYRRGDEKVFGGSRSDHAKALQGKFTESIFNIFQIRRGF